MPSGRKKKRADAGLLCEWRGCGGVFDGVDEFFGHVKVHIEQFISETQQNTSDAASNGLAECCWNLCPNYLDRQDVDSIERHVNFHAYHAKLKCHGQQALQEAAKRIVDNSNSPTCLLDSTSRNTIPDLPNRLACRWAGCEYSHNNPELYYCHVSGHTLDLPSGLKVEEGCSCQWDDCQTVTSNRYKLCEHLRSHTQERSIACPTCGGLFANTTKLIDHVHRQAVLSVQLFVCSHCNKEFTTERLLRDHIRHHVNIYKCEHCGMTCPHPSGLRTHMLYRHTEEGQHACGHCSYRAKSESDLRKHVEIHNEAGTYCCLEDGCSYITKTSELYIRHIRTHRQPVARRFACHVCHELFVRGAQLTVHLMNKHNFSWPPGHRRFRYKRDVDGLMRLQTVRFEGMEEGLELGEQSQLPGYEEEQQEDEEEEEERMAAAVTEEQEVLPRIDVSSASAAEGQQLVVLQQQHELLLLQQQLQDGMIVVLDSSDGAKRRGDRVAPAPSEPAFPEPSQPKPSPSSSNVGVQQQHRKGKKQPSARATKRSGGAVSSDAVQTFRERVTGVDMLHDEAMPKRRSNGAAARRRPPEDAGVS